MVGCKVFQQLVAAGAHWHPFDPQYRGGSLYYWQRTSMRFAHDAIVKTAWYKKIMTRAWPNKLLTIKPNDSGCTSVAACSMNPCEGWSSTSFTYHPCTPWMPRTVPFRLVASCRIIYPTRSTSQETPPEQRSKSKCFFFRIMLPVFSLSKAIWTWPMRNTLCEKLEMGGVYMMNAYGKTMALEQIRSIHDKSTSPSCAATAKLSSPHTAADPCLDDSQQWLNSFDFPSSLKNQAGFQSAIEQEIAAAFKQVDEKTGGKTDSTVRIGKHRLVPNWPHIKFSLLRCVGAKNLPESCDWFRDLIIHHCCSCLLANGLVASVLHLYDQPLAALMLKPMDEEHRVLHNLWNSIFRRPKRAQVRCHFLGRPFFTIERIRVICSWFFSLS